MGNMTRINRAAFERMIWEDLQWLLQHPRTLERDHIALLLKQSVDIHYPRSMRVDPCDCHGRNYCPEEDQ